MNTYIKQYFDIITFMIFMFVMHIANVEYNLFYKVVLVFLGYLLLKYALMRFLHKMCVEFIFLSLTFLLLLPKYPPEVGHYVVSGKVISKYIIKSGKPHIRDKYICKFVFTNVEGKSEVLEREDKYLYDNCPSQSYIIFETPLARKGYIDVLNYHPDSARVDNFRNGKCVVSEPKANTPLVDDPEVRANAIAARSDDKSNLPYCFYGLSMVIVCLLNAYFDRLGFCSLVVMLASMAYYQWQYCDSIFTMMLCWLVTPIVVFLARNLGNKIRVVNAVRRRGGYLVSADIDVRVYDSIKPTKKDVKVKFFAPQGGIQNFKDPFMSVNISKSCKAILVHPLGNYCEFFVYIFDKAVTDDLYERFRKPVLIKFGFNEDSKDKFSFLESISDK